MTERDFWLIIYRALLAIANAIKQFKIDTKPVTVPDGEKDTWK